MAHLVASGQGPGRRAGTAGNTLVSASLKVELRTFYFPSGLFVFKWQKAWRKNARRRRNAAAAPARTLPDLPAPRHNTPAFSATMQQTEDPPLPPELQGVPREVVEAYVGDRLRSHIRARGLALGLPEETLQALAQLGSAEVAPEGAAAAAPASPTGAAGASSFGAHPSAAPASSSGSRGERRGRAAGTGAFAGRAATKTLVFFHDCQ